MKAVLVYLEDSEHGRLNLIKKKLGVGWKELLIRGAYALNLEKKEATQ